MNDAEIKGAGKGRIKINGLQCDRAMNDAEI